MSNKEYVCAFRLCTHESHKVPADEAVKSGARYYHADCLKIRDNIQDVKRLYFEHISNTVVASVLMKTINSIVFDKGIDSEYLLFALKFAIAQNIKINHPFGLHYIIDNANIKRAWQSKKAKEEQQKIQEEMKKLQPKEEVSFTFTNKKNEGFDSIFGGGKF